MACVEAAMFRAGICEKASIRRYEVLHPKGGIGGATSIVSNGLLAAATIHGGSPWM